MNYQPGYDYNQFNNLNTQKQVEKRKLADISKACGSAVVCFAVLGLVISLLLTRSQTFMNLYNNNPVFETSVSAVMTLVTLALPFYLVYNMLKQKNIIGELPLGTPYDRTNFVFIIPVCVMICFIGSFATGIFSTLVDTWFGIEFTQPEDTSTYTTVSGILLSVLQTALIPAFIEEFAVRGVVMQPLRRYGDGFAIIMSSMVFALMHGNMVQIPFAFIAGIAIGYAVIQTGSMWTGVIIHFINNFLAVVSLAATDNLTQAQSSVFIGIMYVVIFAFGIIGAFKFTKRNKNCTACLSRGETGILSTGEKVTQFIFTVPMIIAIGFLVYETSLYIS